MKSTIEIKTAFEGCANVCEFFKLNHNDKECISLRFCGNVKKTIAKLLEQTADNPLDDLFADSMEKLDGLGGGRMSEKKKEMMFLVDTIQGEINRMCVTHKLSELDTMALHANKNIEKLQNMIYLDRFVGESEE